MKYLYSEVFENYVKIASEQGLVDITKQAEETDPRYSSNDLSDAAILYGIKPNGDQDILDEAHPKTVIISPAHDKMNGVIENLKERQNIMVGVALKPNNGLLTQHIYAKASQELFDEVVKIGFLLDKDNQNDLMKLADICAENLSAKSSKMIKNAWTFKELGTAVGIGGAGVAGVLTSLGPVGWGLMAGGLVVMGLVNHFGGMIDQGVVKNCERAISELQDIVDENHPDMKNTYGQITAMIKNISYVKALGTQAASNSLGPSTANQENIAKFKVLIEDYKTACQTLAEYIPGWIDLLKASTAMAAGEKSSDVMAILKKVWQTVYPDEVQDSLTALQTLQESLAASSQSIDKFKTSMESYLDKNKSDIIQSIEGAVNKHRETQSPADHWQNEANTPSENTDIESQIKSKHETGKLVQ